MQAVPHQPELQDATAKLCFSWWQADAVNREALVTQTLPYMLVKALTTGGTIASHSTSSSAGLQSIIASWRDSVILVHKGEHICIHGWRMDTLSSAYRAAFWTALTLLQRCHMCPALPSLCRP